MRTTDFPDVRPTCRGLFWTACLLAAVLSSPVLGGERVARSRREPRKSSEEFAARRLLQRAQDLLVANEAERGVKMLETLIEQFPDTEVRLESILTLGKHFADARDYPKAIGYFRRLNGLDKPDEELRGRPKGIYLEGIYLTGVAHYHLRQYGAAFPILRKITNDYPNTVWANQAYYYIGMCHFVQKNWNKAIQALSLVGTFVDPNSPTVQYVEAGRRFYVKLEDADLPVLHRLGNTITVTLTTGAGDSEKIVCIPLASKDGIFIGSVPTDIATAKKDDGTLQVVGGDEISTAYADGNTKEGEKDVARTSKTRVVSTAAVGFTLGTYESRASAAFLGQPSFILLHDADLDKGAAADKATVRLISRYKALVEDADAEEEEQYKIRDEMTLTLEELGEAPVRTGRFGGRVTIDPVREDQPISKADGILSAALDDEVLVTYVDELHIGGEAARQAVAHIRVIGELDARPRATQNVVADPVIKAKRNLVEATAYLELARIFKAMGLMKGAKEKCGDGLGRVEAVIRSRTPIPSGLKEQAFKLKWELYLAQDDYRNAIATCKVFHRLYPESPFVDQALLGIGRVHLEGKNFREASSVFKAILALPKSQAKAEAQFRIAEAIEAERRSRAKDGDEPFTVPEAAIQQYKVCAERYPESEFAGASLAKLVDYQVESRDYAQANELLEQIFQDYPDAPFLDSMLLKWVLVAYRTGDFAKAHAKCTQLMFEYPASSFAKKAESILPKLERKLKK